MSSEQPKEYIVNDFDLYDFIRLNSWVEREKKAEIIRSRPHPAPAPIAYKECFGDFDDCPCDDECSVVSFCEEYCKNKNKNSCGMTESQCGFVIASQKAEAAHKASEELLDNIWKFICAYQQTGFDGFPSVKVVNLQVHLESLRGNKE